MPWAHTVPTAAESDATVAQFARQYAQQTNFELGVWDDGGTLVGSTGFHLRHGPRSDGIAEVGMWVRADRAGRGLGQALLRAVLAWGFSAAWGFRRLVWVCDEANGASAAVARRCGMTLEGCLRETIPRPVARGGGWGNGMVFAMLRSERLEAHDEVK